MQIIKNEKTIQRNARVGFILSIAAFLILGAGMYISFAQPDYFYLSIIALLVGFFLSQIGIFFTNRWGRTVRPDQILDKALKGLDKQYSIYHYLTPSSHLLIGPAGIWVLLPKHQRGTITYQKSRWRQKGGGILLSYLKIFGQEGIGRPDLEIESEVDKMEIFLKKNLPDLEIPPINVALVFFHPDVNLQVDDAPTPTLPDKKLKDLIRKEAKTKPISMSDIQAIQDFLGE